MTFRFSSFYVIGEDAKISSLTSDNVAHAVCGETLKDVMSVLAEVYTDINGPCILDTTQNK